MKPQYRIIPYLFVLFFIILIAVDSLFIYLAENSYNGVITKNAYQKGLEYNKVIQSNKRQQALGWSSTIKFKQLSEISGILEFSLFDAAGKMITNAEVSAIFMRPVTTGYDFESWLTPDHDSGTYKDTISFPLQGQWEVKIKAHVLGEEYFTNKRIVVY